MNRFINKFWSLIDLDFEALAKSSEVDKVILYLRYFYLIVFVISIQMFNDIRPAVMHPPQDLLYVWPIQWIPNTMFKYLGPFFGITGILSSILCFFYIHKKIFKVTSFISLFMFWAIVFAFNNYIFHSMHIMIISLFLLCLLPSDLKKSKTLEKNVEIIKGIWLVTFFILLTYTCAGISKFIGSFYDLYEGGISMYNIDHLNTILAQFWEQKTSGQIFSHFIISNNFFSFLSFLFVLMVEFFAILAAFRTKYLQLMGLLLIVFHFFAGSILGDEFPTAITMIAYWLLANPLASLRK